MKGGAAQRFFDVDGWKEWFDEWDDWLFTKIKMDIAGREDEFFEQYPSDHRLVKWFQRHEEPRRDRTKNHHKEMEEVKAEALEVDLFIKQMEERRSYGQDWSNWGLAPPTDLPTDVTTNRKGVSIKGVQFDPIYGISSEEEKKERARVK